METPQDPNKKQKKSTSEVGNAKNVANFQLLIDAVTGYGTKYKPSRKELELTALENMQTTAEDAVSAVIPNKTAWSSKVNARTIAFSDLQPLATRLLGALDSAGATKETVENAKTYNGKLQGKAEKKTTKPKDPADPDVPEPDKNSSSQQSYDLQIEHFAGIISVLASEPSYSPNEPELQIAALETKKADLITTNKEVGTAYNTVSNSRIARDKVLYAPEQGILDISEDVKKYIKSIYGATSPEYAQVKGISFKKPKKKK